MQRGNAGLHGLRLMLWGLVLLMLIGACALIADEWRPRENYSRAVMVWRDGA